MFYFISKASISNNDIALVRLVRPIDFTPNVRAVRLPNRRQVTQTFENQMGRISGWGATGTGDSSPNRFLRVAFSPIISQVACRIRFPNSSSDRTLCIVSSKVFNQKNKLLKHLFFFLGWIISEHLRW